MNIIVDANIAFSGILNTNGKIANLLINSGDLFTFIAPDFLRVEIRKHYPKIIKISGLQKCKLQKLNSVFAGRSISFQRNKLNRLTG